MKKTEKITDLKYLNIYSDIFLDGKSGYYKYISDIPCRKQFIGLSCFREPGVLKGSDSKVHLEEQKVDNGNNLKENDGKAEGPFNIPVL